MTPTKTVAQQGKQGQGTSPSAETPATAHPKEATGQMERFESASAEPNGYARAPVIQADSIKAGCLDCRVPYPFGLDLILPDQQWNHLVPGGTGLLCAGCISKRAGQLSGATVILGWIDHFDWTAPRPAGWFHTPSPNPKAPSADEDSVLPKAWDIRDNGHGSLTHVMSGANFIGEAMTESDARCFRDAWNQRSPSPSVPEVTKLQPVLEEKEASDDSTRLAPQMALSANDMLFGCWHCAITGAHDLSKDLEVLRNEGRCSPSLLQRRFRYGYTHAIAVCEELERRGYVTRGDKGTWSLTDKINLSEHGSKSSDDSGLPKSPSPESVPSPASSVEKEKKEFGE